MWNAEEARKFLTTVEADGNAQFSALFALALDAGLRKGELLGLRWSDLSGATLKIERQLIRGRTAAKDAPVFGPPKCHCERKLDLSEKTLALLAKHRSEQRELKMANRLHYGEYRRVDVRAGVGAAK